MSKKLFSFLMILCVTVLLTGPIFAQGEEQKISGEVSEIAGDFSYMVVGEKKIITSEDFWQEADIEVGDTIEVFAEGSKEGPIALDYDYIFE
ncbi:MAG: hypothetical protein KKB82_09425 [Candidatus Omnitrophica bacterium]|nr:hypothetical protein [Candidatus Omnitrophota bacterium]MBU1926122.1 hypothetical protein [Candidatus Omnitrophota bacterium]